MAICVKCEHKTVDAPTCKNEDLPTTDFLWGVKACVTLNPKGACKGFKKIPEPTSSYETKEDEELGKT